MPFGLGRAREPGPEPAGNMTDGAKQLKNVAHQKRVEMLRKTNGTEISRQLHGPHRGGTPDGGKG